ncbi:MAG: 4a-hydroxytetrahydrobiopterin dehydratase [Candidatus Pacebacteria bacterium]|nr:4a-hydroxytetrahydrobiopterin dehydratase [Candidatus Paceibacterota bacterium]
MSELAKKRCIPCEGGIEAMTPTEAQQMLKELEPDWMLIDDAHLLVREFQFKNFVDAMAFANKVGEIAEQEAHHPDLNIGWGRVAIELTTHAIHGLSENDFILAAKIDMIQL